jgi:CheY-like chemotaxis protein
MHQCEIQNSSPRVLVADDDPCVLRAIAERCNRMGFDVETANSGLQALIKASETQPDLILIDVHMPEVDGLSVLSMLADVAKTSQHVIVMTGRPGQQIEELCAKFDATCLGKGRQFWQELEQILIDVYPERANEIMRTSQQRVATPVSERPRVLLIDDDPSVKKFYSHKLSKLGADLLFASDGTRGFWVARRQEPTVIIADYWMPRGDAEYLLTRLRSVPETSDIPVVVQSGRNLNPAIKDRLQSDIHGHPGATRILRKSSDVGELVDVLQRLCGFANDIEGAPLYQ